MTVGLVVDIKGDTSNLDSALGKSKGQVGGLGGAMSALAGPVGIAAAGVGVAVVAIGAMTKAASQDRDEQAKLEKAIEAAGAATATSTAEVEEAIAAGQEKAFTDSETRAGLEHLITATGDMKQANKLLALSQDVARKAGVDLETASKAVAKAHAGNTGALAKLLPGMKKQANATDTMAEAARIASGQADLYAKSSAGMAARGADSFAEIGESIGEVFLPVLDAVLPVLLPIIKQFGVLIKAILPVLIPLVKLMSTGLSVAVTVLSKIVGWIIKLISWLSKAISQIGRFLDSINPFKGISLPSLPFLSSASASSAVGTRATSRAGGSSAGVTINVQGAIDPEATARQIRRILAGHAIRTGSGSPAV